MDDSSSIFLDKFKELNADPTFNDPNGLPINGLPSMVSEEYEEARTNLQNQKSKSNKMAKKLVARCADLFLDAKMIEKDTYAKYKKQVDTMSLANTLFQLHTAHMAIEKLCINIATDNFSTKMFEYLSYLQRTVLDINKFLCDHLNAMEDSYRQLRDKILEMEIEKSMDDDEVQQKSDGVILTTRHKKDLLAELNGLKDNTETYQLQMVPSMNDKLAKPIDKEDSRDATYASMMGETSAEDAHIIDDDPYDTLEGY